MNYTVTLAPSFKKDADEYIKWLKQKGVSQTTIQSWFNRFYAQLSTLETFPKRCPVDELQTILLGKKTHKMPYERHLIFYQIGDEKRVVNVVAFAQAATRDEG